MVFLGFFNVSVARGAWAPGRAQGPREAWSLLEGAKTFIFLCFFIVFEAWGSLGNQKTLLFHCFFKVLEGEGREGEKKRKKINSFGDGLREPKPWFSLVFDWFFKVLEGRRREGDEKKNNSFGDGLREPKPSFSFAFSRFPWLGEVQAPGGAQRTPGRPGGRCGEAAGRSWEPHRHRYRRRRRYRYRYRYSTGARKGIDRGIGVQVQV